MARNRIKGITVEIGGDTTGLSKALQGVNREIYNLQGELKDVDRLLKIDPHNTELLEQKQRLLTEAIGETQKKLETLREAEKQVQKQFEQGTVSQQQYDALKREIVNTEQAEKKLSDQLKETKGSLDDQDESLGKTIFSAELAKEAVMRLASAMYGLVKDSIDYNAQMESYTSAFTSFLGDAEKAEEAINNIKEDASKTTFGASDLIEANQMLISAGVNADDAREAIFNLANAVSATGGGNDVLSRMASNLQQVKNVGKATAMDIRQFANAGINIYGLLADYTGKTAEEVSKMDITYEDLIGAFEMASEEGGRYFGAMEAQAQTYNGQLNTLKARIQDTLGTTFKGVSDTIRDEVFPAINRALDSIDFEKLADRINTIMELVGAILPVVEFVVDAVTYSIGLVVDYIGYIIDTAKGLIDYLKNGFTNDWNALWSALGEAVKIIFTNIGNWFIGVINKIIDAVNRVIGLITGNASTISKIGTINPSTSTNTTRVNPVTGKLTGNSDIYSDINALMHSRSASGSVLSNGMTLVGEAGAELLTVNGGVARVTPLNTTNNMGGISINVYGSAGQNVNELADVVMDKIQSAVNSRGMVWA